jgi:hypothetical protein
MKERPKPKKRPSRTYSVAVTLPNGKTIAYMAREGRIWRVGEEGAKK